jgi:hypothetical protein
MNIITRNLNNIKNNVITYVANIWNMKDTREDTKGYTKPRSWQDQKSKQNLPPSRSNLTSYVLNIYGALRFFSFDDDLSWWSYILGVEAGIYRGNHQLWALGSNRLKATVWIWSIRRWRTDVAKGGWHVGPGGRSAYRWGLAVSCSASMVCLLVSSGVGFIADKRD